MAASIGENNPPYVDVMCSSDFRDRLLSNKIKKSDLKLRYKDEDWLVEDEANEVSEATRNILRKCTMDQVVITR